MFSRLFCVGLLPPFILAAAASAHQSAGSAVKELSDTATRETRSADVAKFGNLLGRLTSGVGIDQQNQQQIEANKALARESAAARKQCLTSLFNRKNAK